MRAVYFDCFSGVSGDMTLGAFVDAGYSVAKLRAQLKKLNLDGFSVSAAKVARGGVAATKVTVRERRKSKGHRHYSDIRKLIDKSSLGAETKDRAQAIFAALAEAEASIHGVPVDKVHFHEVGAVDSIVDIVGAAVCLTEMGIEKVFASAVNTGHGSVATEHGRLPVPAPATARLLTGVPVYSDGPPGELATPTGAAILKACAGSFGPLPAMTVERIGHGAGERDLPGRPNVMRIFIGDTGEAAPPGGSGGVDRLVELRTNIDDMSPEALAVAVGLLFEGGALDVSVTPMQMKKGRPGVELAVLVRPDMMEEAERIVFRHTSTLGIRRYEVDRVSLPRTAGRVKTQYGTIEVKKAALPGGGTRVAPEYESVKKAAEKHKAPFDAVYQAALDTSRRRGE